MSHLIPKFTTREPFGRRREALPFEGRVEFPGDAIRIKKTNVISMCQLILLNPIVGNTGDI